MEGLFSEDVGATGTLVHVKRIEIDGEAEAATFSKDYEEGKTLDYLLDEYEQMIQIKEVGWRIQGHVGTDIPIQMNSIDINQLTSAIKDGRRSYFYYFDEIENDRLITEPILKKYSESRIYNFIKAQRPNINYLELNLDASLSDYIIIKAGKLRLALSEQALINPNQDWSYSVR